MLRQRTGTRAIDARKSKYVPSFRGNIFLMSQIDLLNENFGIQL